MSTNAICSRAAWVFPAYLLAINLFVLPIALGGLLYFGGSGSRVDADTFVLSLPLAAGQHGLALAAFVGGLSAATGMVIVETIAVSTMVCNDFVMPLAAALRRVCAPARSERLAAGDPARGDRCRAVARLSLFPPGRRGLCAGQHRSDQLRRGGAVCAGGARRHVLAWRHPRRCAGRPAGRVCACGPIH